VEQSKQKGTKESKKDNTWNYKGVNIHVITDQELNTEDKKKFEVDVEHDLNKNKDQGTIKEDSIKDNGTYYVPNDSSATTITGPSYKTHDNTVTNFVIETAVRGVSAYSLKTVNSPVWLQGTVQTWLGYVSGYLIYVGYKTSKAYNSTYDYNEIYETLVFYTYSNYTSPTDVYYYGTGQNAASYGY
jgi:hypothetical protein